jgi:CRP/FNR family cyclic AMP-dependent transcriptional regulator
MQGTVQVAKTDAEKHTIYRLRYQVYIDEMEGSARHSEADSTAQELQDEWDSHAQHFYVTQDNDMVACARLVLRRHGPFECEDELELSRFVPAFPHYLSMSSRLALHPRLRGSSLLRQLTCAMFTFAREHEIQFDFIDCHPRLLPLYSRLGYRIYRPGFNHPKYTYVVPMVLVLDDQAYLERVRSPFAPIAERFPCSSEGAELLQSRFAEFTGDVQSAACDVNEFWDLLKEQVLGLRPAGKPCDILDGLTNDEMKVLSSSGHVVSCRTGDVVLSVNDPGREIFLILSGQFEVSGMLPAGDREASFRKTLRPGQSFGEIRFLTEKIRYASVVALEPSRVLVLNSKALDRLMASAPQVAAKVYRNLAKLVAARLRDTHV